MLVLEIEAKSFALSCIVQQGMHTHTPTHLLRQGLAILLS